MVREREQSGRELPEAENTNHYAELAQGRADRELRQAEKMEALGRLSGGIAHDFNNMLSVILSYGSLALQGAPKGSLNREYLEEICRAVERATDMTQQLLAFSRRQVIERHRVDLNDVVSAAVRRLRPTLDANIEIEVRTDPELHPVASDPGRLEQVLVNLLSNAREAMPSGGKLTIETANVALGGAAHEPAGSTPGDYVRVSVSDTGHGMDEATRLHVFEPFFAPKERGKSAGLGLAAVYGVITQGGGYVSVESEHDRGATFHVYLPHMSGG